MDNRKFDKFLVVTEASKAVKILIDIEDIVEVREVMSGKHTEIITKGNTVRLVNDKFEEVVSAIAAFSPFTMMESEIKSIVEAITSATRDSDELEEPPEIPKKNKKNMN